MAKKPDPDTSLARKEEVQIAWHALDADTVLARLEVGEAGLSAAEVARRTQVYGPNELTEKPRPKEESIVHGPMRAGIVIQTIVQTAAVLTAFVIGLYWTIVDQLPPGQNPLAAVLQFDWQGVDVQTAETMAFVTLSLCELFRAYTVRSERTSVFKLGVFSNKYMQHAVLLSITLTLMVVVVPFLQPIFNTHMPTAQEWVVIFVLATLPAIAEEITKFFLRRRGPQTGVAA